MELLRIPSLPPPPLLPRKNISAELSLFQTNIFPGWKPQRQPGCSTGQSLCRASWLSGSRCSVVDEPPDRAQCMATGTRRRKHLLLELLSHTPCRHAHIQLKAWEQLLLSEQQREPGPQPRSPGQEAPMLLPRPCSMVMVAWESRKKTRG